MKVINFEEEKYNQQIKDFKEIIKDIAKTSILIEIEEGEIEALKNGQIVFTETDSEKCVAILPPDYLKIVKGAIEEGVL